MIAILFALLCVWGPGTTPPAQCPAPPTSGRIESPSAVYLPLVLGLERSMQKGAGHDR